MVSRTLHSQPHMHKGITMVPAGRWSILVRAVAPGAFRRFHTQDSARFADALCERRVLFVSGSNARGRASVAAAAALARACNQGPSLLVDADDPVHGMADVLGEHELPSDGQSLLWLESPVQKEQVLCQASIAAAQLCAWTTREFLEELLAAKRWRALLEDGTGARLVAAMGMPMQELLGVLDCVQPPPGAEMPVALAQLLQTSKDKEPMGAVVDAGAPALAVQLQSVPPAVAEGLGGVLRLQELVKVAKQAAVPSAVSSGLQMLIGNSDREDWRDHFKATMAGLQQLRQDMAALAEADTGVLLVVHWPGPGERAAQRIVDRLSPVCAVLIGFPDDGTPLLPWLSGIPTVSLPAMEEISPGLGGLRKLSEAMLRS